MLNERLLKRFVRECDSVRLAEAGDFEVCCRLWAYMIAEASGIDISPELVFHVEYEMARNFGDPDCLVWVLERGPDSEIRTRVIGMALARFVAAGPVEPRSMEVWGLYVMPDARLAGTSLALMRQVIEAAEASGTPVVRTRVDSDRMARFYELLGGRLEARVYALEV